MLKKISLISLALATVMVCGAVSAQTSTPQNPYIYNKHKNALKDAKMQIGNSNALVDVCPNNQACNEDDWDDYRDHAWTQTNTSNLYFSTEGNQDRLWRAELRFLADFNSSQGREAEARVRVVQGHTSEGFTIFQLHNSAATGPPMRIEVKTDGNSDRIEAIFREDADSGSEVNGFDMVTGNDIYGWTTITTSLDSGLRINLNMDGEVRTVDLDGSGYDWDDSTNFYWKAGLYLQDQGQAKVRFSRIRW